MGLTDDFRSWLMGQSPLWWRENKIKMVRRMMTMMTTTTTLILILIIPCSRASLCSDRW
jgi:hypothetical protein